MTLRMVRPDSKGRITLGRLAEGVSGFSVTETEDHKIILEPYTEIPVREKWLFNNRVAQGKVKQGLEDAKLSKISKKGSFAKFADDDIE